MAKTKRATCSECGDTAHQALTTIVYDSADSGEQVTAQPGDEVSDLSPLLWPILHEQGAILGVNEEPAAEEEAPPADEPPADETPPSDPAGDAPADAPATDAEPPSDPFAL